jgi:hypothetical protein
MKIDREDVRDLVLRIRLAVEDVNLSEEERFRMLIFLQYIRWLDLESPGWKEALAEYLSGKVTPDFLKLARFRNSSEELWNDDESIDLKEIFTCLKLPTH